SAPFSFFSFLTPRPPCPSLFPYTTLFRSLFHQSRLWIGGIVDTPASFIGSVTGDFENFSDSKSDGTVLDTSSVNYIVSSDKLNVDRKSTRLNSSHGSISYAVFCLKKKTSD